MSEKICTSGHVMNDSDVVCSRCGSSEQLSSNNLNTMENDENKLEGETVAVESAPETITESEAKEAEENAITKEEAEAQGVDVEKAEAEATPVEVVPDTPESEEKPAE